jgi:MscS family membrane protein
MLRLFLTLALAALAAALPAPPAAAQLLPEPEAEATQAADPFGRETPRGTITGLLNALAEQDYIRAANYFDLQGAEAGEEGAQLARQLQAALDGGGTLASFGILSNDSGGRVDDGLPVESERVGALGGEPDAPILLARGESAAGGPVWRISEETIAQLESRAPDPETAPPAQEAEAFTFAGAPLGDWALLLGIAAGSFLSFWLISAAILALLRAFIKDREGSSVFRLLHAALPPLSLFLAVVGFQFWAENVEASIIARQVLLRYIGIVAWVAVAWFALRLVDAVARVATARMERRDRRQAVSVILLLRRAAKVVLLAVAFVAILDTLGFDVTTGIAALGIGGIALALGAQKTVENLVGSVTVIADKPVQVGDFCRVGSVVGTVEDVGIRSTRIRTNERTVVTIPNADFSSQQIENFASRDRFLFNPTIGVEYGISAAKLKEGVEIVEAILKGHEKIDAEGARARFANFGASSLDIEVFSYIMVIDFNESLVIRQELLLTIFEKLEAAGLSIAFPTRKVFLVQDEEQRQVKKEEGREVTTDERA